MLFLARRSIDGTSGNIVPTPPLPSGNAQFLGVAGAASNDVWTVGTASTIFGTPFSGPAVLHFNGTGWSLITPNTQLDFTAVTALSPTNVWAVGTVGVFFNHRTHRQAAIEHWDGTNWSIVSSPDPTHSPGLDSFLRGIAAISASDIWAVGFNFTSLGGWDTLTEHWDGTSWKIIGSANPGNFRNALFGVSTLSDGTVAAVGFQQYRGFDAIPLIMEK